MEIIGEQEKRSLAARRLEAEYIANFQHLFHSGLTIVHPTTKEAITLNDWSVVEQVEDELLQLGRYLNVTLLSSEQIANYPHNMRVLYWIEPNSLGGIFRKNPREGLVIECAAMSRLERLARSGFDEEKMHWSEVEQELQQRQAFVERWSLRYGAAVVYLLGLASTTGWDEESMGRIRNYPDGFNLSPYLIDLVEPGVYLPPASKLGSEILDIFELCLGDRMMKRIQQQIRELLLAAGAMSVDHLQAQIGFSKGIIRGVRTTGKEQS